MKSCNFLISIKDQSNHSWQGTIKWLDTGKESHFRSEREMLRLMDEATSVTNEGTEDTRSWMDTTKIKLVK